jgi:uncharacterized protein YidB (DUF937 family)
MKTQMDPSNVFDALVTSSASPADTTPADKIILRALVDRIANVPQGHGLHVIVDILQRHGLGAQAESWIKSVPNVDVSGPELSAALTEDSVLSPKWVESTAKASGLTQPEVFDHLAHILPSVIERLTPRGELPSEPVLQTSLDAIRRQLSSAR